MRKINKKGNIDDIGFSLSLWIPVGILFILTLFIFDQFNDNIQNHTGNTQFTNESKVFFNSYNTNMELAMDGSFGLLVIGMIAISLMLATKIQTSPVFVVVTVIYMIVIWTMSWILANFWDTFASATPKLLTYINTLYVIPYILNHLVPITLIYSLLLTVTVYMKEQ